ncbi:MAG: hypothetical protein IKJ73_03660 [Lachnospiraceae bacterium]|nr:hypothetical protein [Lachnospiraceae bacterium]
MNNNMNNITNINEYRENIVPDASAFNINEPGIPVEFVSQEFVDQYIKATENNTPDLWGRIEAGFELEAKNVMAEKRRKMATTKKVVGFVAAAALITIIAVPVMMLSMGGQKNEECKLEATQEVSHYEASDSVAMEAPTEAAAMEDTHEEYMMESETAIPSEEGVGNTITNDSTVSGSYTAKQLEEIQGTQTDSRQMVIEGEFIFDGNSNEVTFKVNNISDNQYKELVIDIGDEISLSNSMYVLSMDVMLFEGKITIDSVEIDDLGHITGRIIDLEHQGITTEKEYTTK